MKELELHLLNGKREVWKLDGGKGWGRSVHARHVERWLLAQINAIRFEGAEAYFRVHNRKPHPSARSQAAKFPFAATLRELKPSDPKSLREAFDRAGYTFADLASREAVFDALKLIQEPWFLPATGVLRWFELPIFERVARHA